MRVALLAGGTGGAKLAVGLRDLLHGTGGEPAELPGQLSVIANTADDIEIYGVHVSPDPDLISFRLAGALAPAGFGVEGETHTEMDRRRAAGEDVWFELGDADMAVCRKRAAALAAGDPLTEAHRSATAAYDCDGALVLPMSDDPVRTVIETPGGSRPIQQFLIQDRAALPIVGVSFRGIEQARPTDQVLEAIAQADLIVVGPSNPVISIAPILALPGMSVAMAQASAPVLAVCPLVGGEVLKGPTAAFIEASELPATAAGVASYYDREFPGTLDAWIADEPVLGHPHHLATVEMSGPDKTRSVASEVLRFGASLAPVGIQQ